MPPFPAATTAIFNDDRSFLTGNTVSSIYKNLARRRRFVLIAPVQPHERQRMSMFDTFGRTAGVAGRKENTLRKLERLRRALRHEEPDRVPVSDFFWGGFTRRWRRELGLSADANPYYHYDLDWIVTVPNMDPWIRPFETLKEDAEEVVVKTGFGATMHKHFEFPMPEMRTWEIDTFAKLERCEFDDPRDRRRFFEAGDNQIAGVGDGFERHSPPWIETVKSLRPDFPVFGSMIEVSECLTRLIGQQNAMLWMGEEPRRMGAVINRIGAHYLECAKAEIEAGGGLLDGFVIWGDVAYKNGMFFSPHYWRAYFKPWVARMTEYAHANGLPVIYHGCGNVKAIFPDFMEMKIDAYNPLEAKAGMDCVELRRQYGHRIGFCGNSDIRAWESDDRDAIRREVLRKLNAARGGGYIFQSDHSVSSAVSGQTYDYIVKLVREFGNYPIRLPAEFEENLQAA
jgi:uroporphyrinogen decarboxylase